MFDYLEAQYPQHISPANISRGTASGYYYRYYPTNNAYLATRDGTVYYLGPTTENKALPIGPLTDWLSKAAGADY